MFFFISQRWLVISVFVVRMETRREVRTSELQLYVILCLLTQPSEPPTGDCVGVAATIAIIIEHLLPFVAIEHLPLLPDFPYYNHLFCNGSIYSARKVLQKVKKILQKALSSSV